MNISEKPVKIAEIAEKTVKIVEKGLVKRAENRENHEILPKRHPLIGRKCLKKTEKLYKMPENLFI